MHKIRFAQVLLSAILLSCLHIAPAAAQAARTWVSGVGDDANPCSRTAPCKTFAGAIGKTAAAGIISVLDPGGYGFLTITKSISIQSDPAMGGVLAAGATGILVDAADTDEVFINGLIIDGVGSGAVGLQFRAGKSLTVSNCIIRGFRGSSGIAVDIGPQTPGQIVVMSDCTLTGNTIGVQVRPTGDVTAKVMLDRVLINANSGSGIVADGKARAFVSNSIVTNNRPGLKATNGGKITSFGNNTVAGNAPNGAPTKVGKLM